MSSNADRSLQLGRDLADALDRSDVVGRWMSHHLAELITRCEQNPDDQELAATTREVVLKLWEHKSGAPFRVKPLTYLQPVLRAIARLDPNADPWAFFRPFEEVPNVENLSTYPLLQMACDIDREVGRLIRLSVGTAAEQAISREESWVIAGKETAKTEEDRAVRALEQFMRRMRLQPDPDPRNASNEQNETGNEPALTSHADPAADEQRTSGPISAGGQKIDTDETFDSIDPLTLALQSAIIRCRRLLDQLADLHDVKTMDSEGTRTGSRRMGPERG
ncbi:hypothetical protein ACX80W_12985 [Arthrobacter sp. TMN-37]